MPKVGFGLVGLEWG